MGAIITELCFCKKTGLYVLVMTESTAQQGYGWNLTNESLDDKFEEGFHPTLVLHLPTNKSTLTVMTTDDQIIPFKPSAETIMSRIFKRRIF